MNTDIFERVDAYIAELLAPEDDALAATRAASQAAGLPDIAITAAEGKLLHVLARSCGAERVLEIGTLGGYSTIWLARALPAHGKLITIEIDHVHARVAGENIVRANLQDVVDIHVGPALQVLPVLAAADLDPFDLIFIDADKEGYTEYLKWAVKLSRRGTVIIADNVVRKGEVVDAGSTDARAQGARQFNAALAAESRLSAAIIQTVGAKGHDGMAIAVVVA